MFDTRRREFITLLGGAAAEWPIRARAQQAAMPVIGWLWSESRQAEGFRVVPFRQSLKEAGYIEGQNLTIGYRSAKGSTIYYQRWPPISLVVRCVIALHGLQVARAAATATIPVVFEIAADPVQLGLVTSLSRPGGNMTGVTSLNVEVAPKLLELLHEMVPAPPRLHPPPHPATSAQAASTTRQAKVSAHRLGLELHVLQASDEREFDAVFLSLVQLRTGALVIGPDPLFTNASE